MRKSMLSALLALMSVAAAADEFADVTLAGIPRTQVEAQVVDGKEPSMLPPGCKWALVWNDEFDAKEIDRTKWMCRESFWGEDFPAFAHDFEGVEMTGETVRLHLLRKGDDFCSPHLQTGSLVYDPPYDKGLGIWSLAPHRRPLFMHKYGYYEIRCRSPRHAGWHCAFWLQAPGSGSTPDAASSGIETDIMENYAEHTRGKFVGGNIWGGYGAGCTVFDHFEWTPDRSADGWHRFGCEWTPDGYTFWCDGKKIGEQNHPVSHVEQFILVSTEPAGYRRVCQDGGLTSGRSARVWGKPDPRLFDIPLPDFFEVDYVRVFDEVPGTRKTVGDKPDEAVARAAAEKALATTPPDDGRADSMALRAFDAWRRAAASQEGDAVHKSAEEVLVRDAQSVIRAGLGNTVCGASVLLAAWGATRDETYETAYWKDRGEALRRICGLGSMTAGGQDAALPAERLPAIGAALAILAVEGNDVKGQAKARSAEKTCARRAIAASCAAFFGFASLAADVDPMQRHAVSIVPGKTEIVVAENAPDVVRFAAEEMRDVLAQSLGAQVPIVKKPTGGMTSIVLGDTQWSRAAAIDVSKLDRDASIVKVGGSKVFIAGRDSASQSVHQALKSGTFWSLYGMERATLFGVYDFLEREVGARFYFPGELGTVVPPRRRIDLPCGQRLCAPASVVRKVALDGDGPAPVALDDKRSQNEWKTRQWLRLRLETRAIPCGHGQNKFSLARRFHATHPEYFALCKRDGKTARRESEAYEKGLGSIQMCQSSGMWDELYEDCKAYLTGKSAESRGVRSIWNKEKFAWNMSSKFIDVMPEDGMYECFCENCQRAYDKSSSDFASELVWGQTARLARRLSDDGLDAIVTQMAYSPYRAVPKCDIPSNVWVMVAETGPWGWAKPGKTDLEIADLRQWTKKLGHKVWMWTYPGKWGPKNIPGAPDMAPRAWGNYYKAVAPYSFGAYAESECEKTILHYLNYYVFSKVMWDPSTDVEKLLDEHFRLMFGPAAKEMSDFYSDLEDKWTRRVLGDLYDSVYGPAVRVLSEVDIWRNVYSKAERARWRRLFDRARAKVAPGCIEARRLDFVRREFLGHVDAAADAFEREADPETVRARYRAMKPEKNLFPMQDGPVKLTMTDPYGPRAEKTYSLKGKLKPDTTYRISAVIRLENVVPRSDTNNGGCFFDGYVGSWQWFPRKGALFSGTADWFGRSYTFKTPKSFDSKLEPRMGVALTRAKGTAWIECLSLVEEE